MNDKLSIRKEMRKLVLLYGPFIVIAGFETYHFIRSGSIFLLLLSGSLFALFLFALLSNLVFLVRDPQGMQRYQDYYKQGQQSHAEATSKSAPEGASSEASDA